MSRAGPERFSPGCAPGGHSCWTHGSWLLPRWGRWVRGPALRAGEPRGEAHFREDPACDLFRIRAAAVALEFLSGARRMGPLGKEHKLFNGQGEWGDAKGVERGPRPGGLKWGIWRAL